MDHTENDEKYVTTFSDTVPTFTYFYLSNIVHPFIHLLNRFKKKFFLKYFYQRKFHVSSTLNLLLGKFISETVSLNTIKNKKVYWPKSRSFKVIALF